MSSSASSGHKEVAKLSGSIWIRRAASRRPCLPDGPLSSDHAVRMMRAVSRFAAVPGLCKKCNRCGLNGKVREISEILDPRQRVNAGELRQKQQGFGSNAEVRVANQFLYAWDDTGVTEAPQYRSGFGSNLRRCMPEQLSNGGVRVLPVLRFQKVQHVDDLRGIVGPKTGDQHLRCRPIQGRVSQAAPRQVCADEASRRAW